MVAINQLRTISSILASLALLQLIGVAFAKAVEAAEASNEEDSVGRLYITRSERREAGLKHELTPWLTASFLLELEAERNSFRLESGSDRHDEEMANATLQAGFVISPWEHAKGELVLEYDTETKDLIADEAFISAEVGDWEAEAGRMYTPFGVYISHFATGPILELGETRADVLLVSYGPSEQLDISLSLYRGKAREAGKDTDDLDWAVAFETWPTENLQFGMSYQSDLADSDERLLEDFDNRYRQRVAGLGGFAVWTMESYEISLEAMTALRAFQELEPDRNRPIAWNLEFVHFLNKHLEWALRYEGSREIEEAPDSRFGISLTWRIGQYATLTGEYLYGRFRDDLAVSDNDEAFGRVDQLAMQFSLLF